MSDGGFNPDNQIKKNRTSDSFGVVKDLRTKQFVSYPSMPKSNVSVSTKMVGEKKTILPTKLHFKSNHGSVRRSHTFRSENFPALSISHQMILRCVLQLKMRPFGRTHIINILSGKQTPKIIKHHHERLYLYGTLKRGRRGDLSEAITKLIGDKYLVTVGVKRPTINITQKGIQYLNSLGVNK